MQRRSEERDLDLVKGSANFAHLFSQTPHFSATTTTSQLLHRLFMRTILGLWSKETVPEDVSANRSTCNKKSPEIRKLLKKQVGQLQSSLEFGTKTPLMWSLPVRKEVLNVSQMAVTLHGISPPLFIQTRLQKYCKCSFLEPTDCPLCNTLCFTTVRC